MSRGERRCENCNRNKRSDGEDLEVCFSHILHKWLCLYCYLKGTSK